MINFIFITNAPDLAQFAESAGVQRIMIDLERDGKLERQGHLDTLISQHSLADIKPVKARLDQAELIVRLNPLSGRSLQEIDSAIASGADILMLPMFYSAAEVEEFVALVDGRARVMPLVETYAAAQDISSIAALPGVSEVFIGLNDLHLDMGLKFMFQPVASGLVEELVSKVLLAGKPCGFGGIARVGEGLIPGEMVLAEHVRVGSTGVILSRTFHRKSSHLSDLHASMNMQEELHKLRNKEQHLTLSSLPELKVIQADFQQRVAQIVNGNETK